LNPKIKLKEGRPEEGGDQSQVRNYAKKCKKKMKKHEEKEKFTKLGGGNVAQKKKV